jgi:hypothetical protein
MSKNRFEQLIEYVINDEEEKARELFHDIVVEKSRSIYESLMAEDAEEEVEEDAEEELEEGTEEELEEDDAMGRMDVYDEALGGDAADQLVDEVEAEESGLRMEGDDAMDHGDGEVATKDDIMDLKDKIDELLADFADMMSDSGDESVDIEVDGDMADAADTPDMTDDEVADDELETEGMMEAINLKQVHPKVTTSEEGDGKAGPVAANSGARGAMAKPVKMTGDTAQGRPAPTTKDLIGKVGNSPAQGTQDPKAAPKPVTSQASGVNARTPFPKA